jgi:hypothetical protein
MTARSRLDHHAEAMVSRIRVIGHLAALTALVLALSGCLNISSGLEVHANDTVSGRLVVFAPKTELTSGGRTQEKGFADYRKLVPPLPKGDEAPYDDGVNFGVHITYTNTPLAQFNGNIKIVHAGNRYTFSVVLDPAALAAVVSDGDVNSTRTFVKSIGLEMSVTLPGALVVDQTNGKIIDNDTVVFTFPATVDKPTALTAVSEVAGAATSGADSAGAGTPWLLIGVGLLVVLLLAVVVVLLLLLRRRGRPAGPNPAGPSPAAAQSPPGSQQPGSQQPAA